MQVAAEAGGDRQQIRQPLAPGRTPPKEQSWNLLWDERYKGKIANAVEMDGSVIPAAMVLGFDDPYAMTDAQLAECRAFLDGDVRRHADGIARCIAVDAPPESLAAFVSFSFNVGIEGFCRSGVRRDLNAGRLAQACAGLSRWVYAGRPLRRVQGLVNRRAAERRLCERGLR